MTKEDVSRPVLGERAASGENAAVASVTGAANADDAVAFTKTKPNPQAVERELAKIRRHNLNVRAQAYKEVRRPGKNFAPLLENLQSLRGGPEIRAAILQQVIEESLRFKRRTQAALVQQILSSVEASANTTSAGVAASALLNNNHSGAS